MPTIRGERDQRLAAQRVRDYLLPHLGHVLLQRVTREQVRSYRLALERTSLSVQSVRHVLSDQPARTTFERTGGFGVAAANVAH